MYVETRPRSSGPCQPGHRAGIGGRPGSARRGGPAGASRQRARSGRGGGGGVGERSAGARRGGAEGAQVARGGRGASGGAAVAAAVPGAGVGGCCGCHPHVPPRPI